MLNYYVHKSCMHKDIIIVTATPITCNGTPTLMKSGMCVYAVMLTSKYIHHTSAIIQILFHALANQFSAYCKMAHAVIAKVSMFVCSRVV